MTEKDEGNLSIRDCRLVDIEGVLELWRQAEATPGVTDTADDLRRAIAATATSVLVAEVAGRIVGSVIGGFDGWRGNIYRLAVHPDHRRRGIARALVASVEERFARQGVACLMALELAELFRTTRIGEHGMSHLSDNVVLLQHVLDGGEVKRGLAVLKTRASEHDARIPAACSLPRCDTHRWA